MLFVFIFLFLFCLFCRMFVGIITENFYETSTHPLGQPRSLTACCIC
ncbi:MAG: hypothetical protein K6253_00225 [Candidatus Liberibacter asiaticus]|nr:hypothetical protein [Candidatus Liberibacter asiaticus]